MHISAEENSPGTKQVTVRGKADIQLMNDGVDQIAAISVFDSEASAMASNSAAADVVADNLTEYLPTAPSITAGRVRIAWGLKYANVGRSGIESF